MDAVVENELGATHLNPCPKTNAGLANLFVQEASVINAEINISHWIANPIEWDMDSTLI